MTLYGSIGNLTTHMSTYGTFCIMIGQNNKIDLVKGLTKVEKTSDPDTPYLIVRNASCNGISLSVYIRLGIGAKVSLASPAWLFLEKKNGLTCASNV